MERRHLRKLSVRLAAVALTAALVVLGLTAIASGGRPTTTHKSTACPFKGGQINMFMAQDLKAVIGEEIGPAGARAAQVWRDYTNAHGGILGCKFAYVAKDETFGDIPAGLRLYRDAIASKKYDFFLGPTNSALMAALPDLTNAAGKPIISGIAADHQPFFEKFKPLNFHASVSTFLEGRASAVAAKRLGCKTAATMVPNYAYGQDAGKAFKQYFQAIIPGGKVVNEQFPEFNESNFTPFINAMVAAKPDCIFSAFFGPFVVPFWKQWHASGNDKTIKAITGLNILATFVVVKSADEIPANTYGYNRADWQLLSKTKTGATLSKLYLAKFGKTHPLVSEFAYQIFSALQLAKALIEKTHSLDGKAWKTAVEKGDFSFASPYHNGPSYVNPINHMVNSCAAVGRVVWNPKLPIHASYNPKTFIVSCMNDILKAHEATTLTKNPGVSAKAIATYYRLSAAVK
jgi:ABC-type branched-subunit amino acid transport system substrate-binding protein